MKRVVMTSGLVIAALGIVSGPAYATNEESYEYVDHVVSTPDNDADCVAWARDTVTRTTTITATDAEDVWDVRVSDSGTWSNTDGTGGLEGYVTYTVTGTPMSQEEGDAVQGEHDFSDANCKSELGGSTSIDRAGGWALRYFEEGATANGITDWEYLYTNNCEGEEFEQHLENDGSESMGLEFNFTKVCEETIDKPSPSEPEPTASLEPVPSESTSVDDDTTSTTPVATLPTTGNGLTVVLIGAVGLILAGAVAMVLTRNRRNVVE